VGALLLSVMIAFAIPKRYDVVARIMPPDQQGSGATVLAALLSHSGPAAGMGGLGGLLGGLLSTHTSSALFEDLLQSGTVTGHLIDRFHLQQVYHTRYRIDAAKRLARRTTITDNKKSGVISIKVTDTDPVRARDLAQAYLDELNKLLTQTSTSSAHQERIFIERRLQAVSADLEQAQIKLSEFSSRNSTVDIKEQTRAMVDAAARVQAQVLVEQSGLDSLRQIYGDDNVRVRASEAQIATLQRELGRLSGSSAPLATDVATGTRDDGERDKGEFYPALRQLPRLAVPFADLYRRVQVQEAVFELLTQQYELARIEEAKDVPVVSVIDAPGIPEKKAFPPRLLLALSLTGFSFVGASALILMRERWAKVDVSDPRKLLAEDVLSSLRKRTQQWRNRRAS
jgi:capsule polysaccharide export protein KpsE/RkpR